MKIKVQLEEIDTHRLSNYVDVEDIIRRPDEVEWKFESEFDFADYEVVNRKDFLEYQYEYKIHYLVEE